MKMTVNELATNLGVSYQIAYGILGYLRHKELVVEAGTRPNVKGHGRGATLYEIPEKVELVFFDKSTEKVILPEVVEEEKPEEKTEVEDEEEDIMVA